MEVKKKGKKIEMTATKGNSTYLNYGDNFDNLHLIGQNAEGSLTAFQDAILEQSAYHAIRKGIA